MVEQQAGIAMDPQIQKVDLKFVFVVKLTTRIGGLPYSSPIDGVYLWLSCFLSPPV
jgi:hypothetical protein